MNKWQKIGLAVGMGAAVVTTTHLINSIIFKSSTANNYTGKRIRSNYQWKFGNIAYVTAGSGSPLLLIHDLNSYSSSYEWEQTINSFAKNHKLRLPSSYIRGFDFINRLATEEWKNMRL